MHYKNPLIVGVTGGMGSGQSTVCSFFKEWGCHVINADDKAKEAIHRNKELQRDLKKAFGNDVFVNGRLNTKRLAELAFRDELNTRKLNQLVHPRMVQIIVEEMESARFSGKYPIIIIDAALIYEISIEHNFDYIVVVNAPVRMRQMRVSQRDKITRKDFYDRVSKQLPLEDKAKWADFVIDNKGELDALKDASEKVFKNLMNKRVVTKKTRRR